MIITLLVFSLLPQYADSVLPPARANVENLAVARAMDNCGLKDLIIINPKKKWPHIKANLCN